MSDIEHTAAQREALRTAPRRGWSPSEEARQDALARYLAAVAAAATARGAQEQETAPRAEQPEHPEQPGEPPSPTTVPPEPRAAGETLRVRDVMRVPAASVPGDMPFLDVARALAREQVSALPVVDAEDHVIGVVSESDLLAKAAVMAEPRRHGPVGRLWLHRLYDKSRGDTAATLMTFPPVTVHPWERVTDAAWTACHARLKRLPVTDHRGRLVGAVSRKDLLLALIRDDPEILAEVRSLVEQHLLDPGAVEVAVHNGVVTLTGRLDKAVVPGLLESVRDIDDVVGVVDDIEAI